MSAEPGRRGGDTTLFDGVYSRHSRAVYALLFAQEQQADVAADLMQDTFVRVWSHIRDLGAIEEGRRLYWLLHIARNVARDHHRRRTVRRRVENDDDMPLSAPGGDPQKEVESRETQRAIDAAIARLPLTLREPLTLAVMAGMTSAEIACVVGCPAATVRYRIAEARRRIAREIGMTMENE